MAKANVVQLTKAVCEPHVEELGYDLVDVEFVREGSDWFLRLYIDRRGGIGLDDCAKVSETVDPLIEEQVPIQHAYYFEVSSPGLDRPLKTVKDFKRYADEEVEVKLYKARDGVKKFTGKLLGFDEEQKLLQIDSAEGLVEFAEGEYASVKRVFHF